MIYIMEAKMNSKAVKVWMLQNDISVEALAVMLKISYYTARKILRGDRVNDSLVELLRLKSGIPLETLLSNPAVTHDVAKVKATVL